MKNLLDRLDAMPLEDQVMWIIIAGMLFLLMVEAMDYLTRKPGR